MYSTDPLDDIAQPQMALWTDPDVARAPDHPVTSGPRPATWSKALASTPAASLLILPQPGNPYPTSIGLAPSALSSRVADQSLATRLATAPGLVRAGAGYWDHVRTPLQPLALESAYADPRLLRDLGVRGARFARELEVDVVVGAETAGVPLAASVALAGELPFAFVRKPGYRGHEIGEPPVRGAEVAGRRVLLVDDGVASGASVERFTAALAEAGAEVAGVFVLVDMREVSETVTSVAAALPTEAVSSYLQVLALATSNGLLDPSVHKLSVDAIVNHWSDDDPRWENLSLAA